MFLAQADRFGDRALYRFHSGGRWRAMSWREARGRVGAITLGLAARDVVKGERVALFFPNRVEWCLADWANICLGALTVPVYASRDRKSTRLNSSHVSESRMPSS